MDDLKTMIGADKTGYEKVMGKHGLGQINENGEMLADFCAEDNLVIGESLFPHETINKAIWVSPNHVTEKQIDHICIGRRFRRSLQYIRVKRGADAAPDHHLLTAKLQLKVKKCTTTSCSIIKYKRQENN